MTGARAGGARPRLVAVVTMLLGVPVAATWVGFTALLSFVNAAETEPHVLDLAGRQRFLAAELHSHAAGAAEGRAEDQAELRAREREFGDALRLLQAGGTYRGHTLPPPPATARPALAAVNTRWVDLRGEIVNLGLGVPVERGAARLHAELPRLAADSDAVVQALVEEARGRRRTLEAWSVGVSALAALCLLAGVLLARRYAARPLTELVSAVVRLRSGDRAARAAVGGPREVAELALAFNELATTIQELLGSLEHRRREVQAILDTVPSGLVTLDAELRILAANPVFEDMAGAPAERLAGRRLAELARGVEVLEAACRDALSHQATRHGLLVTWEALGAAPRACRVAVTPMRGCEHGQLLLVMEDVAEEERLAAEVRASEQRFRAVVDHTTDAIVLADAQGLVTYVNPAAETMFGWALAEITGLPLTTLIPRDMRDRHSIGFARYLATGTSNMLGRVQTLTALHRNATVFPVECTISEERRSDRRMFIGVMRDVSAQRQLAARAMQMDRMLTAGTLAGGVAHEVNNPLSFVLANLDHVGAEVRRLAGHPAAAEALGPARLRDVEDALRDALAGAERVRTIVQDLRTLAHQETDEHREPLSVHALLEVALRIAGNEIRHRARVMKAFGAPPEVEADEARLSQVFLAVLLNAAQAIPEGAADSNLVTVRTFADDGGNAVIEISDTGAGIPAELQTRVFDPFFTTKPVGQGTGLGLSICRATLLGLGGDISFTSAPGHGTTFRLVLPPAGAAAPATAPVSAVTAGGAPGRRGRILVVDDEPLVGAATRRTLADEHDVVPVASGAEALARLEEEPFDLILCDVMMPEMSGEELYEALVQRFPEHAAKMIFMTGGAFTPRAAAFLERVPHKRLHKPVDADDLKALIRGVLKEKPG
ncbi:MAG: PAS domain S-box protein [Deltaproteobacteria bacterium]|nr:PAS domain S-box protein [Deltaproteobacteria bacterium]